eukprot:3070544-Prymnesium_polylepis.1
MPAGAASEGSVDGRGRARQPHCCEAESASSTPRTWRGRDSPLRRPLSDGCDHLRTGVAALGAAVKGQ